MTPQLRKAHRYIWFALAILLPLGWLAAIRAIPGEVFRQPVRAEQPAQLPLLIETRQSGDFIINLREDSSRVKKQIEIFVKKPLTNPNTTVTVNGKNGILLGTRGVFRFEPDSVDAQTRPLTLRFEDKIRARLLRTVIFQ